MENHRIACIYFGSGVLSSWIGYDGCKGDDGEYPVKEMPFDEALQLTPTHAVIRGESVIIPETERAAIAKTIMFFSGATSKEQVSTDVIFARWLYNRSRGTGNA